MKSYPTLKPPSKNKQTKLSFITIYVQHYSCCHSCHQVQVYQQNHLWMPASLLRCQILHFPRPLLPSRKYFQLKNYIFAILEYIPPKKLAVAMMQTTLTRAQSSDNKGRRMKEILDTSFSSSLQSVLSKYTV